MSDIIETVLEEIDDAAAKLADANDVEAAWALRGFADGLLTGERDEHVTDNEYRGEYTRGFNAGQKERNR